MLEALTRIKFAGLQSAEQRLGFERFRFDHDIAARRPRRSPLRKCAASPAIAVSRRSPPPQPMANGVAIQDPAQRSRPAPRPRSLGRQTSPPNRINGALGKGGIHSDRPLDAEGMNPSGRTRLFRRSEHSKSVYDGLLYMGRGWGRRGGFRASLEEECPGTCFHVLAPVPMRKS